MADHIAVDTTGLRETAAALGRLKEAFDDAGSIADGARADLGSPDVADAVNDFADNWKIRRGKLTKSLDSLRQMANDSAETFETADEELATELAEKTR